MIQQLLRGGLVLSAGWWLAACGADSRPGLFPEQVEYDRLMASAPITAPTDIVTPAANPMLEFPQEIIWQNYYFDIDSPSRRGGEGGLPVDRWVAAAPGQAIADVGAGGGYYTFRYAPLVNPGGFVHAIDADWHATRKMAWEAGQRDVRNVRVTQVPMHNLGLEDRRFDTVLMVSTGILMTCERTVAQNYLEQIARALRPGGQLIYIDPVSNEAAGHPCPQGQDFDVLGRAAAYFDIEEQIDTLGMGGGASVAVRFRLRDVH